MKTIRILLLSGLAGILGAGVARANFNMSVTVTCANSLSVPLQIRDYTGALVSGASNYPSGSPITHSNPTYYTATFVMSMPDSLYGQPVSIGNTQGTSNSRYSAMFGALATVSIPYANFPVFNSATPYDAMAYTSAQSGAAQAAPPALVGDVTVRNPQGDTSPNFIFEADTYSGNTTTVSSLTRFGFSLYTNTTPTPILPTLEQQFLGTTGQWRWAVQNSAGTAEVPVMVLDAAGNLTLNDNSSTGDGSTSITLNGHDGITLARGNLNLGTGNITNVGSLAATSITISGQAVARQTDNVTFALAQANSFQGLSFATTGSTAANYAAAFGTTSTATGTNSFASGDHAHATGAAAVAQGYYAQATGSHATALGTSATASQTDSFAIGYHAQATGTQAVAIGPWASASGNQGISLGGQATGAWSIAIGANAAALGGSSFAQGADSVTSGDGAVAMGESAFANGLVSMAFGFNVYANSPFQTVIGLYNTPIGTTDHFLPVPEDVIFLIGNGTSDVLSNAMTVRFDAGTTIGTGLTSSAAAQIVLAKYNDTATDGDNGPGNHAAGLFTVGMGSDDTHRKNAVRVLDDGSVLIASGGDIGMGAYANGQQP